MEFLIEYGMFLAKLLTVVLIILFAIGVIIFIILRAKGDSEQLNIKNINEKYEAMSLMLNSQVLGKKEFKKYLKIQKQNHKEKDKTVSVEKKNEQD